MNEIDRTDALELLRESSKLLEECLTGISEAESRRRPSGNGWSVAEIVEHVAVAEDAMFAALTRRFREQRDAANDLAKENALRALALDRTRKLTAPEPVRPAGRFGSMAAALAHFRACRAQTVAYVEQCQDDLRRRTVKHPLAGIVSGYEFLLILALHPVRHAAQIRELFGVRGEAGR